MRLRQEAKILKEKSIYSLKRSIEFFNQVSADGGRATWVLIATQHSFEMLIKSLLLQFDDPKKLFDKDKNRSLGLRKCIGLARINPTILLSEDEAGMIAAVDELRDSEQHWHNHVSEALLYHHIRASVTLIDDLLARCFQEKLADHLPMRVLPLSTEPLQDIQVLIDTEYSQIKKLLQPGRRATHEAKARVRTLLALHSHADPEYDFGEAEVERVTRAIRSGKPRNDVLPALDTVNSSISGEGVNVSVRVSRRNGVDFRYVSDSSEAAGIRKVDLRDHFSISSQALAEKLKISTLRVSALRSHTGIDNDPDCRYEWEFGKSVHAGYSAKAVKILKDALGELDMDNIWEAHNPMWRGQRVHLCRQPNCAAQG